MSLISTFDFWIQSIATLFAIVNIYLLTHGYIKRGCQVGLVGQVLVVLGARMVRIQSLAQ